MQKNLLCIVLCIATCLSLLLINVDATTSMGYYDREDESNNSISTADTITSERVMQGKLDTSSDTQDYYYIPSSTSSRSIYIQLSKIPSGCDYDLSLVDYNGNVISSSTNGEDKGEWISANLSAYQGYYIRVYRCSGSASSSYYRLYTQYSGVKFNQSFYITYVNSDSWMYCLGRDNTNNIDGLVFLSFGEAEKKNGVYGINDLNQNWASMTRVAEAVQQFINGYNANPKHTQGIHVVVSINNAKSGTNYQLSNSNSEYYSHGAAFKSAINSISTSGLVYNISGGIDAELNWNTPAYTKAWVDGFSQNGNYEILYNFGDHAGRSDDFSGESDPSFDGNWKASDIHYISYGNSASYCVPQVYVSQMASQWTYQKKWRNIIYSGVMSTNGWGYISTQDSYTYFYNKLSNEGVAQELNNKTWITLLPPANPG